MNYDTGGQSGQIQYLYKLEWVENKRLMDRFHPSIKEYYSHIHFFTFLHIVLLNLIKKSSYIKSRLI